jgi:DNA-binding GntR family transcriptional regulator
MKGLRGLAGPSSRTLADAPGAAAVSAAAQSQNLTELRLLVELHALRKLAGRGLSDSELAVSRKLADATMRPARSGDVLGYLHADMVFHLYLWELTGDPAVSEVARLLLAPDPRHAPRVAESRHLMTAGAREHRALVNLLADDLAGAADDLLRHHISRPWAGQSAPARYAGLESVRCEGT